MSITQVGLAADQRVSALADRAEIRRTLHRYAQGVDQRQWSLFRSAFAPDATVAIPGWVEGVITVDRFIELLEGEFDGIRLSGQHHLANTRVVFAGTATPECRPETARSVTEFLAINVERAAGDPTEGRVRTQYSGGLQVDELGRYGDNWLIRHRVLVRKNDEQTEASISPQTIEMIAGAAKNPVSAGL